MKSQTQISQISADCSRLERELEQRKLELKRKQDEHARLTAIQREQHNESVNDFIKRLIFVNNAKLYTRLTEELCVAMDAWTSAAFVDALRELVDDDLIEVEYPGYDADDDVLRDLICNTLDSKCRVKVMISITEE